MAKIKVDDRQTHTQTNQQTFIPGIKRNDINVVSSYLYHISYTLIENISTNETGIITCLHSLARDHTDYL